MKKIKYNYNEEILEETLNNGLKIYLYNTTKTKNFYITVSTHFGAEVLKYKKDGKTYDVTTGSAHFLEHRVMDFTKNKEAMEKINQLGSLVNAYTTYNGTNYNIFSSNDILENMRLLFDRVFNANIKKEDVENERGIILEEYNMYFDDSYFLLHTKLNENLFKESFIKYPVLGKKEDIETVTKEELERLYKDFYIPNNMFVVVTGNFNTSSVLEFIENYTKNIKSKIVPKIIKKEETEEINTEYEEMNLPVNEPKIIVGYKTKIPKGINKTKYKTILEMGLSAYFSPTGNAYETLVNLGIKRNSYGIELVNNYAMLYFKASTDKCNDFIKTVEEYLSHIKLDNETLKRKKKSIISSLILSFEDIIGAEDNITTEIFENFKLNNKKEELINSITLKEANDILKLVNIKNKSIFKITK